MSDQNNLPPPADLIVAGVPVYGAAHAPSGADALAVAKGRIVAVGREADIIRHAGPHTQIIRPQRGCIIPGLVDGHAHMDREGLKTLWPSLDGANDREAIVERIADLAGKARPGEWIITMPLGGGPSYAGVTGFLQNGLPDRHDLDRAAPDNPVYIRSIWGYWRPVPPLVSIANSKALAFAGIDRNSVPPSSDVTIVRDDDGEPTGVFLENTTMPIVELTLMACAPHFTMAQRASALVRSMEIYNSFGTTGVYEGHGASDELAETYRDIGGSGRDSVRARLVFSPAWNRDNPGEAAALLRDWHRSAKKRYDNAGLMRISGLYAEIDEGKSNWLRAAAAPQTGWAGFHYDCGLPRAALFEVLEEAARQKIQVSCIAANVPPLYEEVDKKIPVGGLRWAWGHIGVVSNEEIARARDLGMVLVTHTNRHIGRQGSQHLARLGAAQADQIVPMRKLLDAGVPAALGSDNVPPSLWHPISHVVTRRDGFTGQVIAPSQALSRAEALNCATVNGAYLAGMEEEIGILEPGKRADFIVLDRDYFSVPDEEIAGSEADIAVVNGKIVYERSTH